MATKGTRADRRTDALSKDRIVGAAIEVLDAEGDAALTFRALSARLATGAGAIYWHVANKDELLAAATSEVIVRALGSAPEDDDSLQAIRSVALAVFDAIDAHAWVGTQLAREPWQPAALEVLEALGSRLDHLGVPRAAQFDAASALMSYLLGLAGQYAAGARLLADTPDREAFLATVADRWEHLGSDTHPFLHRVSGQLRDHDDRQQFLAGLDLILAGIVALDGQASEVSGGD